MLGLFQLYPTVYLHKATRGAEKIFTELLSRIIKLIKEDSIEITGLPKTHPLAKFAQAPDNIESVLALDDTVLWGSLSLLADSGDKWISNFAERMRDRKLYGIVNSISALTFVRRSRVTKAMAPLYPPMPTPCAPAFAKKLANA